MNINEDLRKYRTILADVSKQQFAERSADDVDDYAVNPARVKKAVAWYLKELATASHEDWAEDMNDDGLTITEINEAVKTIKKLMKIAYISYKKG